MQALKQNQLNKIQNSIFDLLSESICIIDSDYNIQYCNKNFSKTVPTKCYHTRGRNEKCEDCKTVFENTNLSWNRGSVTIHDFPISTDTSTQVLKVIVENSKLQEVKKSLVESELLFKALFEHNPSGILMIDEDYRIRDVNQVTCNLTGYSREQLVGELCDIVCPKGSASRACPIWELGATTFNGMDTKIKCNGGHKLPILKNAQVFQLKGKRFILEAFQDISERKKADELRESAEQQLNQARKMEGVGRLAGGIAHDLNNLLAPILGYAELLSEDIEDLELKYYAEEIHRAGSKARDLVKQLLAFSRKQNITTTTVTLEQIIDGFKSLLSRTIRENILISTQYNPSPKIAVDQGQIEIVLMNLVINAQDAMPEGGTIRIKTDTVTITSNEITNLKPGKYALLTVNDIGLGINESEIEKIFEPFFSTKGEHGTGLGLATVYGIVKQHKGHISVISNKEIGTTFSIYFPAASTEPNKATILVVQDSEVVQRLAKSVLQKNGYNVILASSCEEAVALCDQTIKIDLVLCDLSLPEMSGLDLTKMVRDRFPTVKTIFTASYTAGKETIADICLLQKPFSVKELSEKVAIALSGC